MPLVNIKYKLTKDDAVDTVKEFLLQGVKVRYWEHRTGQGVYEGTIKKVRVASDISVEVLYFGLKNAGWSLEIQVDKIQKVGVDKNGNPVYAEVGDPKKTTPFPIKDKLTTTVKRYYNQHKIKWQ